MWILNIIAFLLVTIYLAVKADESFAEVLPVTACGLIMVLYLLGHIRCLSRIDGISIGLILYAGISFFGQKKEKRGQVIDQGKEKLFHPVSLMILLAVVTISVCVQGRIALWWDDVNFWATDVKSIYYLDGFAGKYGNVAPEFGDYPPGVQLFKWWFLHFSPGEFKEGLMFAGYYTLNMLLLAPLFSKMKKESTGIVNGLQYIGGGIGLFLIPSVVETFYLEGMCADLTMAIAYGLFLWSVIDEKNHKRTFSYVRQVLTLSLIMICKNTGFQWVIYGLIFWLLYHRFIYKEEWRKIAVRFLGVSFFPVMLEGSWLLSCLLKRRVAKLTGAGIKMAVTGNLPQVDYRLELWKNFFKGFVEEPIHRQNTMAVDLSVLAVILLAGITLWFYRKKGFRTQRELRLLTWYFGFTAVISYGITLLAHMTIFVTELQYLEPVVMTASIERYGAPFTVGLLYVLWQIWIGAFGEKLPQRYLTALCLVCLCAQWPGAYHAVIGYRSEVETKKEERSSMVEEAALLFAQKTKGIWKDKGTRVLYLRDGSTNHSVKDTYINYQVSPLGVVYGNTTEALTEEENCRQLIQQSHAAYLYADDAGIESELLFEKMTEEFRYETLYKIEMQGENITLVAVE